MNVFKNFQEKTFQGICRINSSLTRSQLCISNTQRYSNVDALTSKLQCCSNADIGKTSISNELATLLQRNL